MSELADKAGQTPRWEYKIVGEWAKSSIEEEILEQLPEALEREVSLQDWLNYMGSHGWELVWIDESPKRWYFKRHLPPLRDTPNVYRKLG